MRSKHLWNCLREAWKLEGVSAVDTKTEETRSTDVGIVSEAEIYTGAEAEAEAEEETEMADLFHLHKVVVLVQETL